jgi:hypothetical protein
MPAKLHAVKLVYDDIGREQYEPVKEVTKQENISYMAELYSRCQVSNLRAAAAVIIRTIAVMHSSRYSLCGMYFDGVVTESTIVHAWLCCCVQETRAKTQQQLAEKYLQPLVKPKVKSPAKAPAEAQA